MKLGFGLGTSKRQSLADIEREAAAEIQMRVDAGKPPREDWDALKDRAPLDTDVSQLGQWSAVAPEPIITEPAIPEPPAEAPARRPATPKAATASKPAARKPAARKRAARQPATRKSATRKSAAVGE